MKYLRMMRGQKTMVWGNHDKFSGETYKEYFNQVRGFTEGNADRSYFNVGVDTLDGIPVLVEDIKAQWEERKKEMLK